MSFIAAAAIVTGGQLLGGLLSAGGAQQQADYALQAAQIQQSMYNQTVAREQPFVNAGGGAAATLQSMSQDPNSYLNSGLTTAQIDQFLNPAFSGALQYGLGAQTNLQNMSGGAFSGNTLAANTQYAGNQFLNNAWNPAVQAATANQQNIIGNLQNLATMGSNAAGNNATGASSFGQNIGNSLNQAGAAIGGGTTAIGNALASAAGTYGGASQLANMQTSLQNSLYNSSGGLAGLPTAAQASTSNIGGNSIDWSLQ